MGRKRNRDGSYDVEKILDKRIDESGTLRYLIKWKGYGENENSWTRLENMQCPEMLKEFEESLKSKEESAKELAIRNTEKATQTSSGDIGNDIQATKSQSMDQQSPGKAQQQHPVDNIDIQTTNSDIQYPEETDEVSTEDPAQDNERSNQEEDETSDEEDLIINNPFERGLEAEFVLGVMKTFTGRKMLIKWKGIGKAEFVSAKLVNKYCPQLVIKFYEDRCCWNY